GPALPHCDRVEFQQKYSHVMLMFFKPWRSAIDLRENHASWRDTFEVFQQSSSLAMHFKMKNMQIMHECHDSRDD
ncbi:uncharacterized protein EDB91DRAFT_1007128, partial [Suillus paluster]|uniref:uncharacterized protein n=1 Tax=Suillus paluster TaxID=48578 RepID=UPI001B881FA1